MTANKDITGELLCPQEMMNSLCSDQVGVHLRKAPAIDKAFAEALQGTLSEWDLAADDEAYANL
jgi:hypothetical protein